MKTICASPIHLDQLSNPNVTEKDVEDVQQGLEAIHIAGSELQMLQEKQRAAVQRAVRERPRAGDDSPESPIHPDLHDLSFGALGPEQRYAGPLVPQLFTHESWSQGSATANPAKHADIARRTGI
jgi:hypothetical protein